MCAASCISLSCRAAGPACAKLGTDTPACLPACLCCPQEILKLVKKIPAGVQSSCKRHWQAQHSLDVTCGDLSGRFHMDNNGVCYVTYEVRCSSTAV